MRKVARILIRGDPLLILAIMLIVSYAIFAWQMRTPRPFAPVVSDSMEPYLHKGHLVVMESVHSSLIREGDVIVFKAAPRGRNVIGLVHRVVRVEHDPAAGLVFWTKGDNREAMDGFGTPAAFVEGRVKHRVPYAGYVIWFFQSPAGWGFLSSMIALYMIYRYGDSAVKRLKKYFPGADRINRLEEVVLEQGQKTNEALDRLTVEVKNLARKTKRHAYRQAGKRKKKRR